MTSVAGKSQKVELMITIVLGLNTLCDSYVTRKNDRRVEERESRIRELEEELRQLKETK